VLTAEGNVAEKITQRTVRNLLPLESGNRIIWDTELKGFGVKITPTGEITFLLNYRAHGRQRRYKIGRNPEWSVEAARLEAAKIKPRIDSEGYDPLEAKQVANNEPTLRDLSKEYLERHYSAGGMGKLRDKQTLDGVILPRIGGLRLSAIGSRDIEKLHRELKGTPYRANRVLALLSSMFSEAMRWKWTKENPARGIERYQEHRRERWLQDDELTRLHSALNKYPDQKAANAIRLIALTGSRKSEVLKAKWDEFDMERGVWTKPSHHTKQKKREHVPLSGAAIELLRAMRPENAIAEPLFPGRDGKVARVSLRKPWTQVCKAAGLAESIEKAGKRRKSVVKWKPLVRLHDLRHTFASHLVSRGTSLQIVGKLIGHTQISTTMRYAHLADGALRDAANAFGEISNAAAAKAPKAPLQVVELRKDARKRAAM
jgi:integrase